MPTISNANSNRSLVFFAICALAVMGLQGLLYPESAGMNKGLKAGMLGAVFVSLIGALLVNYEKYKRYVPYVIAFLISQTGFSYEIQPGYITSANEVLTVAILMLWVIGRKFSHNPFPVYFSRYLKFFILIALAGTLTAIEFQVPSLNIFDEFKSYVLYTFYLFLIPDCVKSEEEMKTLLLFMIILSLKPLFYGMVEWTRTEDIIVDRLAVDAWGTLNIFMGYIVPLFFMAVGFLSLKRESVWPQILTGIYLVGILYASILSHTRSAWGALILGFSALILVSRRSVTLSASMALIAIIIMIAPGGQALQQSIKERIVHETLNPNSTLEQRFERWEVAWVTAKTYPLTGSGWGGFLLILADGSAADISIDLLPRWHNSYLEVLSQVGFPGLLLFLLFWGKIIKTEGIRIREASFIRAPMIEAGLFAAVISCLTYALGEQQFYRIETVSHTYFLAGLLLATHKLAAETEKPKRQSFDHQSSTTQSEK